MNAPVGLGADDIVLGLDPSSTCVGYGILTLSGRFVEAGILKPSRAGAASFERDMELADDVAILLGKVRPAVLLVEWTKGKVGKRHKGLGAGLAVYGTGVGAVGRQCWLWARDRQDVHFQAVLENDWSRRIPKDRRQLAVATLYPEYAPFLEEDRGGDIADGIGMAHWWVLTHRATQLF